MNKITQLLKYNCFFTTLFLFFLVKLRLIDKNIVIELIRRKKARKLYKKYKKIIENSIKTDSSNLEKKDDYKKVIWTCWLQGENNAPDLVKKCIESIRKKSNGWEVVVITEENFNNYIELPDYLINKWKKGIITNTHFSDILRCALLIQHGGIWIDSTCYLSDKIPQYVYEDNKKMFCFKHKYRNEDTIEFGSWFIFSQKNNRLLELAFKLECEYWKEHNYLADYFLFHIFIYICKDYYKNIWDIKPNLSDVYPHEYNRLFNEPFDEKLLRLTMNNSFIHKLSNKNKNKGKNTFYNLFFKEK